MWDLSLVDPDNRRPVDYAPRPELLHGLDKVDVSELIKNWRDGRIKMLVTRAILRHRREHPELFRTGSYVPLKIEGEQADRFVAFLRQVGDEQLIVIAAIRLGPDGTLEKMGQGTRVVLPEGAFENLANLLTSKTVNVGGGRLDVVESLGGFPVAVLSSAPSS